MGSDYTILIVDDVVDNIQVAMNVLKEDNYDLSFALSGAEALALIEEHDYDLILLDIMMPEMDGYDVCRAIKALPAQHDIPIIFLTAKVDIESISKAFEVGGVDYITKPFNAEELLVRVRTHIQLYNARKILEHNNLSLHVKYTREKERLLSELEETQKEIIYILAELTESVSDETGQHIKRVAEISKLLAHYCPSLNDEDVNTIFYAAPMHDIGKIAIDHDILCKPSKLTNEEFEIMQTHTNLGHKILKKSERKIIKAAGIITLQHHERWDGSGYPHGLKANDIHIYGRIVALADVFDALTHKRVYKDSWTPEDATAYIQKNSGTHFDPELVEIFMNHIEEFIALAHI